MAGPKWLPERVRKGIEISRDGDEVTIDLHVVGADGGKPTGDDQQASGEPADLTSASSADTATIRRPVVSASP